ncbi:gamma-glutamyltransferase [Nocardioides panacisoli]|uniref:Glutathione hydrolase proenzyme n=1 Tax=Nocardioides panacisoli TaxID=627624 RepID=A0ABP7HWM1_9ACTN
MLRTTAILATAALGTALLGTPTAGTAASPPGADRATEPPRNATVVGHGGAVTSVDPNASRIGLKVLKNGGNAVDAAVATAAALGVTEPYSSGLGGGGYFVYYDADSGKVRTIDGRETAPAGITHDAFIDPDTGQPYPFTPDLVTSGVSVGVPGTPATWDTALDRWGSLSLREALKPAARLARNGFVVDDTFNLQTTENEERFQTFTPTKHLFLAHGVPAVGSTFKNPLLARTYDLVGEHGVDWLYDGPLAHEISQVVQHPPVSGDTDLPAPPGSMKPSDLRDYRAILQAPTHVGYRGYDVYGMAPSSSGGSTMGEALNILEQYDLGGMSTVDALHHYLEATALAFADRGKYVGDPAYVDVPLHALLDDTFAKERACNIDPATAAPKPVAPGDVTSYDGVCPESTTAADPTADTEGLSTTHLTTADRWGNVVSYTLTIEQTGGSGIAVPHRGFLLNNELTDFTAVYDPADPNRIEPGKRPRSSMSPTIVLQDGSPAIALGSPGGSTIITTVLQVLVNRLDLGMSLPDAVAAPRASQRNTASVTAEQAFIDEYGAALEAYGHTFTAAGAPGTSAAEIGAVTGIEFGPHGKMTAVAEPTRRGGGDAEVVNPR